MAFAKFSKSFFDSFKCGLVGQGNQNLCKYVVSGYIVGLIAKEFIFQDHFWDLVVRLVYLEKVM